MQSRIEAEQERLKQQQIERESRIRQQLMELLIVVIVIKLCFFT